MKDERTKIDDRKVSENGVELSEMLLHVWISEKLCALRLNQVHWTHERMRTRVSIQKSALEGKTLTILTRQSYISMLYRCARQQ